MTTQITDGVKVSVEAVYQSAYSNPEHEHFMFAYKIRIENLSDSSIQVLSRHWHIFDSLGALREVRGEGVVGQQPLILPGEHYEYVSGCNLKSDMGSMWGSYDVQREVDAVVMEVAIPRFVLMAPYRLN